MKQGVDYKASQDRYESGMTYRRCGRSGIKLSSISLGLWQNFGDITPYSRSREMILHAFDKGVVSFDLANNYGPRYGAAEETFGRVMKQDLLPYRDEMFISTKAGFDMWPGPYGDWGSRKYLISSLDQSLKRMGLEYVDIFYHHRFDPNTPIEETLQALVDIVKQGKALYAGISRWPLEELKKAAEYMKDRDVPCLLLQDRLSLIDRHNIKEGQLDFIQEAGIGFIGFSALGEGVLTNRYLNGIPEGSRAARGSHLTSDKITPELIGKIKELDKIARQRGQTLAQMSTAWVLAHPATTSVITGCSSVEQLDDTLKSIENTTFSTEELEAIDRIIL